jgi:hypothetical protein
LPPEDQVAADALEQAEHDGWRRALDALTRDDRRTLSQALRFARTSDALSDDDQAALAATLVRLEDAWQEHFTLALNSLVKDRRLTDEQRRKWSDVIATLRDRWQGSREALTAMSQGHPVDDRQRRRLDALESIVHALSLEQVKDDTVWRKDEADAWFRLLERLQGAELADLERQATPVGFVPLYRQPDVYRGKLVTISGTARGAGRREAGPNVFGIDDYYMVTVQPLTGNSPIVVYTLELPPRFPPVEQDPQKPFTPLDEPVSFTGYFFKRWAYPAQDGIRTAPLLAAKAPRWKPIARLHEPTQLPSLRELALVIGGTALFGVAVAALVYWQTRGQSPQRSAWRRWLESEDQR